MPGAPLVTKLESIATLSQHEREAVMRVPLKLVAIKAGEDVVSDGQIAAACCLLLDGLLFRYKVVEDGQRQILAFHFPGDIPDMHSLLIRKMDHGMAAAVPSRVAFIAHEDMRKLFVAAPALIDIFWRDTLIDAAVFRAWITAMGRLPAVRHMAHLFCELYTRMHAIGRVHDSTCSMPLTQTDLADAIGLSTVHVNRTLQSLRQDRLLEFDGRTLKVLDWDGLSKEASFDPTFLHIHESKLPKSNAVGLSAA